MVVTRYSSLEYLFLSKSYLPISSESSLMPSSTTGSSSSSASFFFFFFFSFLSSSPEPSSSFPPSPLTLPSLVSSVFLSSCYCCFLLVSISLMSLGRFFISWVPARCVSSSVFSVPHARHLDISLFCLMYIVVSGYLHFEHNRYFSMNLSEMRLAYHV